MKRVKSFDEFVNENLKAIIGSPIKYTKIKNNLKKFQQTKVQKALNDVDFEKKKQKSKGELDAKLSGQFKGYLSWKEMEAAGQLPRQSSNFNNQ